MYHYVRKIKNSLYPKIKGLEFSKFKKQLNYLNKNYTIITPDEFIEKKKFKVKKNCAYSLLMMGSKIISNMFYQS